MGMVIGIDVGGSTTQNYRCGRRRNQTSDDCQSNRPHHLSNLEHFGKYIYDNNISLSGIEKVMLTGVGSAYVNQPLYGLPTEHTDEFLANGLGAHYGSQLEKSDCCKYGHRNFFRQSGGRKESTYRRHRYRWRNHSGTIQIIAKKHTTSTKW